MSKARKNRAKFFSEIHEELKRNNPCLEQVFLLETISGKEKPDVHIIGFLLTGLKMLGATDKFDKDFVVVPPQALANYKNFKLVQTDFVEKSTVLIPEPVIEYLGKISHGIIDTKTLFENVFEKLELFIKIILTSKATNTMAMPH
jgi:hypothetical protein